MPFIQFDGVSRSFRSRSNRPHSAVQDFTLTLNRTEFFCLLGPSGCGKTTVLGMLAGFDPPTNGRILLDGDAVLMPSRDRGVVFQGDNSLYPWLTAIENVEFGLRVRGIGRAERRRTAMRYLDLVGLGRQQDKYPTELSGGMKQRIQIARALANEPRMLLMDEPFGALDAQTRGIMQQELRRIWETTRISVFFITHDIDEAIVLGSRVGIMTAGPGGTLKEVIEIDLGDDRARTNPRYADYYVRIHTAIRQEVEQAALQQAAP